MDPGVVLSPFQLGTAPLQEATYLSLFGQFSQNREKLLLQHAPGKALNVLCAVLMLWEVVNRRLTVKEQTK